MKKKYLKKQIKALKWEISKLEKAYGILVEKSYNNGLSEDLERGFNEITGESGAVKEQSSAGIWADKRGEKPQKGVFDHPKYRHPFTFGPFGNIEENKVEGNPV